MKGMGSKQGEEMEGGKGGRAIICSREEGGREGGNFF